ncbi:hypothetical protein HOK51_06340 [Candidatus Woesearchaeota archaeon]|jgi:uncharacterized protein|nr:hypothetical protein [Candidatus Woesearchaeota archaeon]MBT6519443.1 hypothetical protein [Candidatus Woesearchaeota archaeon]MBT7368895.1 hypothetical protein [Candidatus Woesearchaeota archaeon]
MPHQCVRCNIFYDDGASEILKGCKCGSRLFFYVRKDAIKRAKELTTNLTDKDKHQIEKDVLDLVDISGDETPVILDLESVRILGPGKFELDLVQLFNKDYPLIYKLDEGKYVIDLAETFKRREELSKKDK